MKKSEHAIVTVKPDYGFGSDEVKCDLATVPPCSTIVFEVEMLDFKRVIFYTLVVQNPSEGGKYLCVPLVYLATEILSTMFILQYTSVHAGTLMFG